MEALYHSIYKSPPQACLFTIVPGFDDSNSYILPVSLMEYFSQHCMNIMDKKVMEKAEQLFCELNVTQEQYEAIELTIGRQRDSDIWYNQCQGTASSFQCSKKIDTTC